MTKAQKGLLAIGATVVAVLLLLSVWLGDMGGAVGARLTVTALVVACWFVCLAVATVDP